MPCLRGSTYKNLGRVVQSPITLTFCEFSLRFSVYTVCPSVLSLTKLRLHNTQALKNLFMQEKLILWLTFNPLGFNWLSGNPAYFWLVALDFVLLFAQVTAEPINDVTLTKHCWAMPQMGLFRTKRLVSSNISDKLYLSTYTCFFF